MQYALNEVEHFIMAFLIKNYSVKLEKINTISSAYNKYSLEVHVIQNLLVHSTNRLRG